jgi:hypothetical protein
MANMTLIEYLQKHTTTAPLGGEADASLRTGTDQTARDDLQKVQRTNNAYFMAYFVILIVIVGVTIVVALIYRQEMGGLAVVLGAGGVVQGGLVVKLGRVWMDKARIDIVATLSASLPPDKLQPILLEILQQIPR